MVELKKPINMINQSAHLYSEESNKSSVTINVTDNNNCNIIINTNTDSQGSKSKKANESFSQWCSRQFRDLIAGFNGF